MPVGRDHHLEHSPYVVIWHGLVEEIAHAVNEDPSGAPPAKWEIHLIGLQRDREAISVSRTPHSAQTQG
jgi:hypothetical protein